ncbi:MAG: hypothetical protein ACO3A2_06875 [Bdellovibrionia bacterium]
MFHFACHRPIPITQATGTLWLKMQSSSVSGQFYAQAFSKAPDVLKLEITNFLGGTEALITARDQHFEIMRGSQRSRSMFNSNTWAGIPLSWSIDLILGRIPCPSIDQGEWVLEQKDAMTLVIEQRPGSPGSQVFEYHFAGLQDRLWPESLRWYRPHSSEPPVSFSFSHPEPSTFSPLHWEARTSQGVLQVRWRERQIQVSESPSLVH